MFFHYTPVAILDFGQLLMGTLRVVDFIPHRSNQGDLGEGLISTQFMKDRKQFLRGHPWNTVVRYAMKAKNSREEGRLFISTSDFPLQETRRREV